MKLTTAKKWLKTEDVKSGDQITILNEGEFVLSSKYTYTDGTPRKDFVLKVKHNDQEVDMRVNATNKKILIGAYGGETSDWIGKICKLDTANVMVSGKMQKTIMISPLGDTKNVQYEA